MGQTIPASLGPVVILQDDAFDATPPKLSQKALETYATIGVNQLGGGSSRKPDVRPPFCRVAGFEWWANNSGSDELVEAARRALGLCTWRDKLRDHAAMSRDRNTFASLNPPDVSAQVVFEFADACGTHH